MSYVRAAPHHHWPPGPGSEQLALHGRADHTTTTTHSYTHVHCCMPVCVRALSEITRPILYNDRRHASSSREQIWAIDPNFFFFAADVRGAREKNTKPPRMHARKRWLAEDHMIYLKSRLVRARERRATRHTTPRGRGHRHNTPSLAAPFCKLRRGPEKREGAPIQSSRFDRDLAAVTTGRRLARWGPRAWRGAARLVVCMLAYGRRGSSWEKAVRPGSARPG